MTLVGKDPESNPTGSPTVYRTDRGSWVVQGWAVTDPDVLLKWTFHRARHVWRSRTAWCSSSGRV